MRTIEKKHTTARAMNLFIPHGVLRLARQLHEDPEILTQKLILHGLRSVDWNISQDIGEFAFDDNEGFDITEAMETLSIEEIEELEDYGDLAQRVLQVRHWESKGLTYGGEPLNHPG